MAQGLWVELHDTLREHRKTYALADALRIPNAYVVGLLGCFWTWAITAALDGDVSAFPARALAAAAGWEKKPEVFVEAMVACGWLDREGDALYIHDWDDYAGILRDKVASTRKGNRDRKRRQRDKERGTTTIYRDGHTDVTRDMSRCHAPTVTYTVPNQETDGERAREELPTGDIDVDGPDIVSLDIVRVSDAAAKLGFPVDCITIDPNVDFCVETYGAAETMEALEKTASIIASGRSIGDRWEYAKGILRKTRANGTNAPPGGTGPPASRGYFVLTESGKEYELGKDDFDEELRRYTLRNDLEVERLEPNRIAVRRLAHVEQ